MDIPGHDGFEAFQLVADGFTDRNGVGAGSFLHNHDHAVPAHGFDVLGDFLERIADFGNVLEPDDGAVLLQQRDFPDLLCIDVFADDADGIFDDSNLEVAGRKRLVFGRDRCFDVGQRQTVAGQALARESDVDLPLQAAKGIH